MEYSVIPIRRFIDKNKWVYDAHSPATLRAEEDMRRTPHSVVPLGDLVEEIADGLHGTRNYLPEGIPLLAVGNVQEDGIDLSDCNLISEAEHERLRRSQVHRGDILVTITGRLGTATIYQSDEPANLSAHVARIRTKPSTDAAYLCCYLNSELGRMMIAEHAIGSIYPHINVNALKRVRVVIPPEAIRKSVVAATENARVICRQKRTTASRLVSGSEEVLFRLLRMRPESVPEPATFLAPSAAMKKRMDVDFNLGFKKFDPYADKVVPVGELADCMRRITNPETLDDGQFRYIDIGSIDVALGEITQTTQMPGCDAPSRARQLVKAGDVLVSTVRPNRGAVAVIREDLDGAICSTGFCVLQPKSHMTSDYLHAVLRLSTTREQLARRSSGSSYPAVLPTDVLSSLVPLAPSDCMRDAFGRRLKNRRAKARLMLQEASALMADVKSRTEALILGLQDERLTA